MNRYTQPDVAASALVTIDTQRDTLERPAARDSGHLGDAAEDAPSRGGISRGRIADRSRRPPL